MQLNQIVCGDCLKFIPTLPDECLNCVVTDPPFGENQGFDGDDTVQVACDLLASFLALVEPKLKRNAHLAIFWTMRNLDLCIEAAKAVGFTYRRTLAMYLPRGGARPYLGWLPRTQAIVIVQKYLPKQPTEFHADLANYLADKLGESQFTRGSLAKALACDSRLVMKWTRVGDPAWCLPTPRFYKQLKPLLNLDDRFDILLDREPSHNTQRNDFPFHHDCYIVKEKIDKMHHPTEKPLRVIKHLVQTICPIGGVVLDGFAGSCTTAVAAVMTGRNFICIEKNEEYAAIGKKRIEEDGIG